MLPLYDESRLIYIPSLENLRLLPPYYFYKLKYAKSTVKVSGIGKFTLYIYIYILKVNQTRED